mmetsp:Transcript_18886/g.39758  ORF Transcript_18886/g.39758 Transcript_18886/m.39758 type:complete len:181 (-) Transcript_18886:846-1388(-)
MVHGLKNLSLLLTAAIPVVAAFAPLPSSSSSACHALLTSSSSAIVGSQLKLNEVPSSKSSWSTQRTHHLGRLFASSDDESDNEEARRLQEKAQQLRDQIRQMESQIGEERRVRYNSQRDDDDNNNNNNAANRYIQGDHCIGFGINKACQNFGGINFGGIFNRGYRDIRLDNNSAHRYSAY